MVAVSALVGAFQPEVGIILNGAVLPDPVHAPQVIANAGLRVENLFTFGTFGRISRMMNSAKMFFAQLLPLERL